MSQDIIRPGGQSIMRLFGWYLLIVIHNIAKFDGHRRLGGKSVIFSVVDKLESTCSLLTPPLLFLSKVYGRSGSYMPHVRQLEKWKKQCVDVSNELSPLLVAPVLVTNHEIWARFVENLSEKNLIFYYDQHNLIHSSKKNVPLFIPYDK